MKQSGTAPTEDELVTCYQCGHRYPITNVHYCGTASSACSICHHAYHWGRCFICGHVGVSS